MRYFITGHTGFKGAWLTLLLKRLGHEVAGYSIGVPDGGLFARAGVRDDLTHDFIGDVRDSAALSDAIAEAQPEVAIHLAAQSLVIPSFNDPVETFTTNVNGTLNFLQAVDEFGGVKVALVVTSDKVYENYSSKAFREDDSLGGKDPYSASKAMADLLAQSWGTVNTTVPVHIARAGNVIGAFDVSPYRLLADIWRSDETGDPLVIRNPSHIRPWQHVLDCLGGYLKFIEASLTAKNPPMVLNFGPPSESLRPVRDVVMLVRDRLTVSEHQFADAVSRETPFLALDSHLAHASLGWQNVFGFDEAVEMSLPRGADVSARSLATVQIDSLLDRLKLH